MSNKINIGIEIDVQKLLDTRLLIQAGSGGGKSWAIRKVAESVGNQVQQIIIDPEGEFVTLREKFDFLLVAKGGDIPLSLRYAEMLANKLLETNLSAIIDLYELKHYERIQFVKKFLDALINAPKELWHSCFVYVDEAHIFCPESSKSESMSSVIDLCTRGRKRGFAGILATQRLSKLHKDAAAECLNKMIGRTGLDIDRKRAGDELGMINKTDMLSLRELKEGEFFSFGPAINNEITKFKVGPVVTTHLRAGKRITAAPPTPAAVKKILSKLVDIPEEAEKELVSKQQLQAEVARLRSELTKLKNSQPAAVKFDDSKFKKRIADLEKEVSRNLQQEALLGKRLTEYATILQQISDLARNKKADWTKLQIKETKKDVVMSVPVHKSFTDHNQKFTDRVYHKVTEASSNGKLLKCPKAILQFLATYSEREFTKTQVGVATGYSPNSGGFNNALSELNSSGLIIRNGGKVRANTSADLHHCLGDFEPQEYSIHTYIEKLSKCEREIYQLLLDNPNHEFSKEDLAAKTPSQYSFNSGGFNNALSSLNTLELIKRESGKIRLNPELLEI